MSENYEDDSVWETYVPEIGGMYSEGVYRDRSDGIFKIQGWMYQPHCMVSSPCNGSFIYRRRKSVLKTDPSTPVDDVQKFETVVTSLEVTMQGKILYKVWLDGDLVGVAVDGDDDSVMVSPSSWPALRAAIDRLIAECRE